MILPILLDSKTLDVDFNWRKCRATSVGLILNPRKTGSLNGLKPIELEIFAEDYTFKVDLSEYPFLNTILTLFPPCKGPLLYLSGMAIIPLYTLEDKVC